MATVGGVCIVLLSILLDRMTLAIGEQSIATKTSPRTSRWPGKLLRSTRLRR
jgi:ABC-type proline/glycine betaine transport system permease subunit